MAGKFRERRKKTLVLQEWKAFVESGENWSFTSHSATAAAAGLLLCQVRAGCTLLISEVVLAQMHLRFWNIKLNERERHKYCSMDRIFPVGAA